MCVCLCVCACVCLCVCVVCNYIMAIYVYYLNKFTTCAICMAMSLQSATPVKKSEFALSGSKEKQMKNMMEKWSSFKEGTQ